MISLASAHVPGTYPSGPYIRLEAPSYFTYGSHAAMFTGFTPGLAGS